MSNRLQSEPEKIQYHYSYCDDPAILNDWTNYVAFRYPECLLRYDYDENPDTSPLNYLETGEPKEKMNYSERLKEMLWNLKLQLFYKTVKSEAGLARWSADYTILHRMLLTERHYLERN